MPVQMPSGIKLKRAQRLSLGPWPMLVLLCLCLTRASHWAVGTAGCLLAAGLAVPLSHNTGSVHTHPLLNIGGPVRWVALGGIGDSRVFEMNELCGLFLGRAGQRMFEAAFFLYTYSTMWLYASVAPPPPLPPPV